MPIKAELDAIDWKILRELQADGRMTNVELSRRVGTLTCALNGDRVAIGGRTVLYLKGEIEI